MSSRNIAIQTTGLTKVLAGRRVLDSIDLSILESERVALTGANGAGKTTLLRLLASVARATTGEIRWFGGTTAPTVMRREIGLVAHETRLYLQLSAAENLAFAARMCGAPHVAQRVEWWLHSAGLAGHRHRLPTQLSRGLRQRLAIARGLVHDPLLILLDEPFAGLDADGTEWLSELLRAPAGRDRTIVFATHDPRHVDLVATRVVVLEPGRLRNRAGWEQDGNVHPAITRNAA